MPVIFAGHGSPMNAIDDNRWSQGFAALGEHVQKPTEILAISAHSYVDGTLLTANDAPPTIYDFGGFPPTLYEVDYPAPDHWLPLIYAYVATCVRDEAHFPQEGFDWGSISMRNVVLG